MFTQVEKILNLMRNPSDEDLWIGAWFCRFRSSGNLVQQFVWTRWYNQI